MKYSYRSMLIFGVFFYLAVDIFVGRQLAGALDVALFSWLAYCAIAEKRENME